MRLVVTYAAGEDGSSEHEIAARVAVAKSLAALKGLEFAGGYEPSLRRNGSLYFVPGATLDARQAHELGIHGQEDLFGGVVPHAFMGTKAIAHPLAGNDAKKPRGWCWAFPDRVREVVLPGYTAFSREDARRAAEELLAGGPVRIKPAYGIAGRGQMVVQDGTELERALDEVDAGRGLVVERDLEEVATFSVGQVCVDKMRVSYCGTQKTTRDNRGETVYGGSDLLVARGGYDELLQLELPEVVRIALDKAQRFDAAAAALGGMFASRRNYDVLRGRDGAGNWYCGVLEQSWRIGGASGPEVAALTAFDADDKLRAVHARSTEAYGAGAEVPRDAIVHFNGVDPAAGPLLKYTLIEPYERAR